MKESFYNFLISNLYCEITGRDIFGIGLMVIVVTIILWKLNHSTDSIKHFEEN
jgi:hypothetical protein